MPTETKYKRPFHERVMDALDLALKHETITAGEFDEMRHAALSLAPTVRHIMKKDEHLWIHSMGKRFRVYAIFCNEDEANRYMERNDRAAVIACHGPLIFVANKYEGVID